MIAAIHQPAYLPWQPYLDKITSADVFVLLDTVPFSKGSWINRNFIADHLLLTVPVRHVEREPLARTRIDDRSAWRRKHLASIEQAYSKAPAFERIYPRLAETYEGDGGLLTELCIAQLVLWLDLLGEPRPILRASDLDESGTSTDRLISLCRAAGADTYISGVGARDYLDEPAFERAGIRLWYQDHVMPPPKIAALDHLMHATNGAP